MIIHHLLNPDLDVYTLHCCECKNKIINTYYSCNKCSEFDLCTDCFKSVVHIHPLLLMDMQGPTIHGSLPNTDLSSLLSILAHMSDCKANNCKSSFHKSVLTPIFEHIRKASDKCKCRSCNSYNQLMNIHSINCTSKSCPVLRCLATRIKNTDQKV